MQTIPVSFNCKILNLDVIASSMGCTANQYGLVQNDTGPQLQFNLKDCDGYAINVSGATVKSFLKHVCATSHINLGHEGCSGVDPVNGVVSYNFLAGDLSGAGTYFGDIQIDYGNGVVETNIEAVRFLVRESNV